MPRFTFNRPSCKCDPSPPGGIHECEPGQIAVCGDDGSGLCKGSCVGISSQLDPLNYVAELLLPVIRTQISVNRLISEPFIFRPIVIQLLMSSQYDTYVTFTFEGQDYKVSIGLTEVAIEKLEGAIKQLESAQI